MYKTSGLFFLFFTRQTSKRALLLPCHASRGELKSSKKPKRPAPKAVARLKPGIERCSPDAWRRMAKHGEAWRRMETKKRNKRNVKKLWTFWQCKQSMQSMWDDVGCHCVDLHHFWLFSNFSPRPTCSANLGPWCFSRQPQLASLCRGCFTEADASRAPLHEHFPNLPWSLSERAQRCTMHRAHERKTPEMDWNGAEMDWNGAFGHDGWGRTFQDSIAPTTTGPWGPRKITNRCTDTQRALEITWTNTTNFMFGKKICVMHFFYVGYRSLSEL